MKTIIDYKKEIKNCIESEGNKVEGLSKPYILNPTPRKIKRECLRLLEENKGDRDLAILKFFFVYIDQDSNIKRAIDQFDPDRLKPICQFIRGDTSDIQSDEAIELIALLIDFQPRPYNRYRLGEKSLESEKERKNKPTENNLKNLVHKEIQDVDNKKRKKVNEKLFLFIILGILSILLSYNLFIGISNKCMIWKENHFVKTECSGIDLEIPFDETLLKNFKKINVCDTTTFFKDGKPVVFYMKYRNKMEFFTWYGEHPVYKGKFLDPITQHMITEHVKSCDSLQ